jgi:microcystin-dependent protein
MKELKAEKVVGLQSPSQNDAAVNKSYSDLQAQTVSSGAGVWHQYTATYADLAAAALNKDIELFSLPAGGVIHDVIVTHGEAFTGGSLSSYVVSVGISGQLDKYALAYDVHQAPGDLVSDSSNALGIESKSNATSIRISAVAQGDNLNAATEGAVTVYVRWSVISSSIIAGNWQVSGENSFLTNWEEYPAVITGASTNPQNVPDYSKASWRKVGDSMEISWFYTQNAGNTSNGGSGNYLFNLPDGYLIDLNKTTVDASVGSGLVGNNNTNGLGNIAIHDNKTLLMYATAGSSSNGGVQGVSSAYYNLTEGIYIHFTATVPIVGWSSDAVIPGVPAGVVSPFAGMTPPSGYLLCDGTAVSRSTFAGLFQAIGTIWGAGDGSTTFNLPNYQGIFLRGAGSQTIGGKDYSGVLGNSELDQYQEHEHLALAWANSDNSFPYQPGNLYGSGAQNSYGVPTRGQYQAKDANGNDIGEPPRHGNETRPVNVSVNYIIKY